MGRVGGVNMAASSSRRVGDGAGGPRSLQSGHRVRSYWAHARAGLTIAQRRWPQAIARVEAAAGLGFATSRSPAQAHATLWDCPKRAAPDRLPVDLTTAEMPARDAVVGSIQLANLKKIPIVVIDRDNIWKSEWGELWRYQEEDEQ